MGMSSLAVMANSLTLQFQKPIDVTSGRRKIGDTGNESESERPAFGFRDNLKYAEKTLL
jgi:hypothetical protein